MKKKMLGRSLISDCEPEDGYDAIHGLVFPPHGAAAVRVVVPVTGARRVEPRPVLLHDHTSN